MREDHLFLIKKKEIEHHKSIVSNPTVRERVKEMIKAEKNGTSHRQGAPDMGIERSIEIDVDIRFTVREVYLWSIWYKFVGLSRINFR